MGERYALESAYFTGQSGKVHRGATETDNSTGETRVLVDERCQRDQMGTIVPLSEAEVDAIMTEADPDRLCGHCY